MNDDRHDRFRRFIALATVDAPPSPSFAGLLARAETSSSSRSTVSGPKKANDAVPHRDPKIRVLLVLYQGRATLPQIATKTRLGPGTLTRSLGLLVDQGLVMLERTPEGRFFRITDEGTRHLLDHAAAADSLAEDLLRILGDEGGPLPHPG